MAPAFMTFTAADLTGLRDENSFTDANALTSPTAVVQTTTTSRDRIIVAYNAAGVPTAAGSAVRRFENVSTQTSQPTVTGAGVTNSSRQTSTTERLVSNRPLTAAELAAQPGIGAGTAGRTTQSDGDVVAVNTTSSTVTLLPAVLGETRQLSILTAPGDISFKLGGLKTKLYWDFAYNIGGEGRFDDIYQLRTGNPVTDAYRGYETRDGIAWLVGFQLGETKKGRLAGLFNYRETGIASIDPNLNDSDFALGELNTRGFKLELAYARRCRGRASHRHHGLEPRRKSRRRTRDQCAGHRAGQRGQHRPGGPQHQILIRRPAGDTQPASGETTQHISNETESTPHHRRALALSASLAHAGRLVIKGSDTLGAKLVPQLAEAFKAADPGTEL